MKKYINLILLVFTAFSLWSQPEISIKNLNERYQLGDFIEIDLAITPDINGDNKAFNNIYFDIDYSNEALEWVDYKSHDISSGNDFKLLHASTVSKDLKTGRLILSLNWREAQTVYNETIFLTLKFKVTSSIQNGDFKFNNKGLRNLEDISCNWRDSGSYTVPENSTNSFIWFRSPTDGTVVNKDRAKFSVINSKGLNYKVEIKNDGNGSTSKKQDAALGYLDDWEIILSEGSNTITSYLFDAEDRVLAIDSIIVHYDEKDKGIEIISPKANSVVSQNRISVKVASNYTDVHINKEKALSLGYKENDLNAYSRNIWLKPGFNTITVEATSADNKKVSKQLTIYFENRDEVFRIINPINGDVIKYKKDGKITFTGEISQKYSDTGTLNKVTYDILFRPLNGSPVSIPTDGLTNISEFNNADSTDLSIEAAYKFVNKTPIDLTNLGAGSLEITAYKNKIGIKCEQKTTTVLVIDDSKHEILIEQPRVFAKDELSNVKKVEDFHNFTTDKTINFNNITLTPDGVFSLSETNNTITAAKNIWDTQRKGLIELSSGSMLYYSNYLNRATFQFKPVGGDTWGNYIKDVDKFYIYDVLETSKGLLLGVSNYSQNGNTGLYLLKNEELINIVIGKPITHVQFIRQVEDTIYLYGNDYSHLYSFNINTLELVDGKLMTDVVDSFPLGNPHPLTDIVISPNFNTVALLTDENNAVFYTNVDNSFVKTTPIDESRYKNIKSITLGDYSQGTYYCWLLEGKSSNGKYSLRTVMEKKSDGKLKDFSVTEGLPSGELLGAAYNNDNFHLLFKSSTNTMIHKGQFFFNRFMENITEAKSYFFESQLEAIESDLIFTEYNGFYWGSGSDKSLYNLETKIEPSGSAQFSYNNPDMDGIKGFSFNIPSQWIDKGNLSFDFKYGDVISSSGFDNPAEIMDISGWADRYKNNDIWESFLVYDIEEENYRLDVEFKKLLDDKKDLDFIFRFNSYGNTSPTVTDLNIEKKVPVKLPTNNSTSGKLSIKGKVTDPTVREVGINIASKDSRILVNSDGGFKVDTEINTSTGRAVVTLDCENSLGDKVEESFTVLFFESINGLKHTKFYNSIDDETEVSFNVGDYQTDTEDIYISSSYYGLKGAIVGYEILTYDEKEIIKKGVFDSVIDKDFNETLLSTDHKEKYSSEETKDKIGTLESGSIVNEHISLIPGNQKIRIFVENPGGKKSYFYLDDNAKNLPTFIYNLPLDKEKIVLTNYGIRDVGSDISQELDVNVTESKTPPYNFSKNIVLTGRVETLQSLSHVKVISNSDNVTFDNGLKEILVEVDSINNFNVNANISLAETSSTEEVYDIVIQPTAPYLIRLKSKFRLNVIKDYKGANIIPDFTLMKDDLIENPSNKWTLDEKRLLSKPLRVTFNRSLPIGSKMKLVVNFNTVIDGKLELMPNSANKYRLVDSNDNELNLSGVKYGINRVRWDLYYNTNNDIISSSIFNKPGMSDFIFNISGNDTFIATAVNFNYDSGRYYDQVVPDITFTKDISSSFDLYLNNELIQSISAGVTGYSNTMQLPKEKLVEGENSIKILSNSPGRGTKIFEYKLYYDTKNPVVGSPIVLIDKDNYITYIAAVINEANIKTAELYEKDGAGENFINAVPAIIPLSNSQYKVEWDNIADKKLAPHTTLKDLFIRISDKSERAPVDGATFKGPKVFTKDALGELKAVIPETGSLFPYYSNNPTASFRKDNPEYKNSWVVFDSNPVITTDDFIDRNATDKTMDFVIERPGNISFKGLKQSELSTGKLTINGGTDSKVSFERGFSIPLGKAVTVFTNKPVPAAPKPEETLLKDYSELSVNFSLRIEESPAFYGLRETKRLITLGSEPGNDVFIAYIKDNSRNSVDLALYEGSIETILVSNIDPDIWHNVLINVSNTLDKKFIKLYLDDMQGVTTNLTNPPSSFLKTGTSIYVGDNIKENNGHFTLSQLFYVDRLIGSGDISSYNDQLATLFLSGEIKYVEPENVADYGYSFEKELDGTYQEEGTVPHKLRTSSAVFTDYEDVEYLSSGRALIGSKKHRNYLVTTGNKDAIVFNDCDSANKTNLITTNTEEYIYLKPDTGKLGKYTFGNKPTNHDIKSDDYYTIAGRVTSDKDVIDEGKDLNANLVLRFNNTTKKYPLKEGDFKFIFDNRLSVSKTPTSVVMYIETYENLKLYNNMQFVEGNSYLENDVLSDRVSYASTNYLFNNSTSVELYYKPFNINSYGHVDYDGVILKSNFIDIYTEKDSRGKVYYKASIGGSVLETDIPVMEGWQHLMVTYSSETGQARFYINGVIVSFIEQPLTPPAVTVGDNVFIGGDPAQQQFAEGYIDNVRFTNFCVEPILKENILGRPITLNYTGDKDLKLEAVTNLITDGWKTDIYPFLSTSLNSPSAVASFRDSDGTVFDLTEQIGPGQYFARLKGAINNKRISTQTQFIRDDKPDFKITKAPKLIISNVKKNLDFKVSFNNTYLPELNSNKYPGFAVRISDLNSTKSEIIYVCQDYESQDHNSWRVKTGNSEWQPITLVNSTFDLSFIDQIWKEELYFDIETFYSSISFVNLSTELSIDEATLFPDSNSAVLVPIAALSDIEKKSESITNINNEIKTYEYMLDVSLEGATPGNSIDNIDDFKICYSINGDAAFSSDISFTSDGFAKLYYDDMLQSRPYNTEYNVTVRLKYKGSAVQDKTIKVLWNKVEPGEVEIEQQNTLEITSFDLLYTKTANSNTKGDFYLSYDHSHHIEDQESKIVDLYYNITSKYEESGQTKILYNSGDVRFMSDVVIINNVPLNKGITTVEITIYEKIEENGIVTKGLSDVTDSVINTSSQAPTIVLTNTVPLYISYNNLAFTWKGLIEGEINPEIQYKYNFDNQGWNTPSTKWKSLELYNLDEGFHELRVKSVLNDIESTEAKARFFVDVTSPKIDSEKITEELIYDEDGIAYAVKFKGSEGAVVDSSLNYFYIGNTKLNVNEKGEFNTEEMQLINEGVSTFTFTAIDKVGNRTELNKNIDNSFIELLSPKNLRVQYAPFTLVGKLSDKITQDVKIFIQDPLHFDSWHEAEVNSDRVFFVNDISVNPGSQSREATTDFRLKIEFKSGTTFYKDISIKANELFRPLIVTLSKQATQGAGDPVEITINADCQIDGGEGIASWSIDFDGDGIYDIIDVTDTENIFNKTWKHSYSTLGEIRPRVRVVTRGGEYFTQDASLIIHEKIKSASSTKVLNPKSMSITHLPDGSDKVFVLCSDGGREYIDVYSVDKNTNFFTNKVFTIELKDLIIGQATNILSLTYNSFILTTEKVDGINNEGRIYHFKTNEFGNYVAKDKDDVQVLNGFISSMAASDNYLFVTQKSNSTVSRFEVDLDDVLFDTHKRLDLILPVGTERLPAGTPITYINGSVYAADTRHQRIVEYTENIEPISYWGDYGTNDKQFIQPKLMAGYANRLFVLDNSREDIQVFDSENRVLASLNATGDYLPDNFFTNILSIDSIGREEGGRLYYYLIALSESAKQLSLVRLPQWEEMRAKTRNNKIVFLKDREIFTAKPDGSDLKKVLSTDSLPRIEGVVDYPTISPDGRRLTFVSRKALYTGNSEANKEDTWSYDNLYILNIGDKKPVKVPLGPLDNYEIERPVFNSNGDSIAFSARKAGGFWQIYEYNWNDGTISKLFDSIENLRYPYYSPDDRYLVYTTDYDGDQDLEVFDKENPDIRIEVTSNNFRDSYPVWSRVYPFEISNPLSSIESKIAFVSDRNFKKGIHYVYIAKPSADDIRVVTAGDQDVGDNPDIAAIEVTGADNEGDYPAFTGDGENIVYEDYDGVTQTITKWNYKSTSGTKMNLPEGSQRPSGMKNTITGFSGELINGNEVKLTWTPYTDHKTFYLLEYQKADKSQIFTQKKIYSQDGTTVTGLEMGVPYLFRVIIEENEQKVAETKWLKVKVPTVVARPSYTISEDNPYEVNLHAWKAPKPKSSQDEVGWTFSWIIDNQEITTAQYSQDISYHFATSGEKTIQLKAFAKDGYETAISEPFTVNIVSDIEPIIEYTLITGDTNYLELDATNSRGKRIDMSTAVWTITGPGQNMPLTVTGSKPIIDVSHIKNKVNVSLKLSRHMVSGQPTTDTLEANKVIDLDYAEVKPIISYSASEENSRLITFDGTNSLGNIEWRTAKWSVYADGKLLERQDGVSNFSYLFAESSRPVPYAVTLTVADASSAKTKTSSQSVYVDPAVIEPVIDYEILTLKETIKGVEEEVGVKVILTATGSKGSSIDFNATEWNLPLAAQLGEQPNQRGPTAIFNLRNPGGRSSVDVTITLMRQGGTDVVTKTETININGRGVSPTEIIVDPKTEKTSDGYTIILDVLKSKGADIDWKNTDWLINGQYSFKGPVARIDRSYMGEEQVFRYAVTLHRFGSDPIFKTGEIPLEASQIIPNITEVIDPSDSGDNNTKKFTVLNTEGLNIDWTRTVWSIWDGNESVVKLQGATILHSFVPKEKALGYPVKVEMYLKGDDTPFYGYTSVDIEADMLNPVIQWDEAIKNYQRNNEDELVINFSALSSTGSGIDWSQTKWNFGDGTQAAYGASVQHKYPASNTDKSYKVALTIVRLNRNGSKESRTEYKTINIDSDEVKPVIKAVLDPVSKNLILSAEKSEGRGLLLDRSVWMFAGKGDGENFSRGKSSVETLSESSSTNTSNTSGGSQSVSAGFSSGGSPGPTGNVTGSEHWSDSFSDNTSSSSGSQNSDNNNQSYSTQNTHTGAVCRRYIEDFDFDSYNGSTNPNNHVWVTLFVYRLNSDGSTSGVTLTERIDLTELQKAGSNGKEYK